MKIGPAVKVNDPIKVFLPMGFQFEIFHDVIVFFLLVAHPEQLPPPHGPAPFSFSMVTVTSTCFFLGSPVATVKASSSFIQSDILAIMPL